jgi:hypothetical protein
MVDPEDIEIKQEIDKITLEIDAILEKITTVVPLKDSLDPSTQKNSKDNEPDPTQPDTELR